MRGYAQEIPKLVIIWESRNYVSIIFKKFSKLPKLLPVINFTFVRKIIG